MATLPDSNTGTRTITVLGSTGSIGCNTLDLVGRSNGGFRIVALTAHSNVEKLAEQARRYRAEIAVIGDEKKYKELADALSGSGIKAAAGPDALVDAAERPADLVMGAIVGAAGLAPTLKAVERGATVALANKECLVCAGPLFMSEVAQRRSTLLPVDSEHNAIFQVFDFDKPESVERIILTASGGPFRTRKRRSLATVTPDEAVAHPNWSMGAKISVDSATMMNKGLEMIEAFHLFPVSRQQIEVVVHPQSVIHSMVEYQDGSVLAQMGTPDMRTPIAYALAWPERIATPSERLDLAKIGSLTFEAPDEERFPALRLAREALQAGNAAPAILNAANEVAVHAFLTGQIGFLAITDLVEETMQQVANGDLVTLQDVYEIDRQARRAAEQLVPRFSEQQTSRRQ